MPDLADLTRSVPTIALAFLAIALAAGCEEVDYRPEAIGPESEIVVVMDDAHWNGPVGEAVRGTLSDYVETLPAPERAFDLRRLDLATRFEDIRMYKNVVFVAPYTDTTAVGRFMQSRLPEDGAAAENGLAVHRENLWRRNQMVVYFTAATPEALEQTIRTEGDEVLYLFNRITRQRVSRDMFERGRQQDIEEQ